MSKVISFKVKLNAKIFKTGKRILTNVRHMLTYSGSKYNRINSTH